MKNIQLNNKIKYNNFGDLVKELDYQSEYCYDKRVDLFNKYHISTATKFINPIMLLTEHLIRGGRGYCENSQLWFNGMSHSGAVMSAFNENFKSGKSLYVELKSFEKFNFYKVYKSVYKNNNRVMQLDAAYKEDFEHGVTIRLSLGELFTTKRNFCFYKLAEEFCEDFNFKIKFV